MEFQNVNEVFTATLNNSIATVVFFVPRFITGLIVLLIGLIIASIIKQVLLQVFKVVKLDQLLSSYGVPATKGGAEAVSWTNIFAEVARWFVIIVFLVPTAEIWGLSQFVVILNNFLSFIPSIIVAILLLLVGFVVGIKVATIVGVTVGADDGVVVGLEIILVSGI